MSLKNCGLGLFRLFSGFCSVSKNLFKKHHCFNKFRIKIQHILQIDLYLIHQYINKKNQLNKTQKTTAAPSENSQKGKKIKMAKNLVQKATSDDRDAPQGFLLKELEGNEFHKISNNFLTF
jgi:hypothetical protein